MKPRILILLTLLAGLVKSNAEPVITGQPTNQSVSLGASARFQVSATTTNPPILFQWRFATTNVLTATYLNRLSDLLFILSRLANPDGDVKWRPGGDR